MSCPPLTGNPDDMKMYEEYVELLKKRKEMLENQGFHNYPSRKLEHICKLDVYQNVGQYRSTKIICALGKTSNSEDQIFKLMKAGMNIARLNVTSLGFEQTTNFIHMVRKMEERFFAETRQRVSIAADIAAPTARIEQVMLTSGGLKIVEGQSMWFTNSENIVDTTKNNVVILDVKEFPMMIRYFIPRSRLYIDDGIITVIVRENFGDSVRCLVEQGGTINIGSVVNFLWSQNFLYHCADQYMKTIKFVANSDVDMVMLSFIRDAASILNIKQQLKKKIPVIMKIENYINPSILDSIIAVSDGILIARGLIGIDLPIEKVFVLQNQIIAKCLQTVKPVFVGFQLLDSMITKPRPTRAEAADVANAVLASVDGVILGQETSEGKFGIMAVEIIDKICLEAEATTSNFILFQSIRTHVNILCYGDNMDYTESACISAVQASYNSKAKAIVVLTETGLSAYNTASLRPDCLILMVTRNLQVIREAALYKGIMALWYNDPKDSELCKEMDKQLVAILQWALKINHLKENDLFVCLTGRKLGKGATKTVRILTVPHSFANFEVSRPVKDSIIREILN